MDNLQFKNLLTYYDENCQKAELMAVDIVSNMEIPVFNSLSTLSKASLSRFLVDINSKIGQFETHEKSLIFTILIDVLSSVIKYNDFFDSFTTDNSQLINTLCKQCSNISKGSKISGEEYTVIMSDIKLMEKYAERVPSAKLTQTIKLLQTAFRMKTPSFPTKVEEDKKLNKTTMFEAYFKKNINQNNENIQDKTSNTKPVAVSHVTLIQEKENTVNNNSDDICKPKMNAFQIMMQASKKRMNSVK